MKRTSALLAALTLVAGLAAGCGSSARVDASAAASTGRGARCPAAWKAGWQRLANRIGAPVYCPGWLPDPLTGELGGRWNTINSVTSQDGSYLMGFIWQEPGSGELHVNLRGYPGRTSIPTCLDVNTVAGKTRRTRAPCFSDPHGRRRIGGIGATVYTVNRDADLWHVLYAWRHDGSLYTVSEHVTAPLTYAKVVRNLDRLMRNLVLVAPTSG